MQTLLILRKHHGFVIEELREMISSNSSENQVSVNYGIQDYIIGGLLLPLFHKMRMIFCLMLQLGFLRHLYAS